MYNCFFNLQWIHGSSLWEQLWGRWWRWWCYEVIWHSTCDNRPSLEAGTPGQGDCHRPQGQREKYLSTCGTTGDILCCPGHNFNTFVIIAAVRIIFANKNSPKCFCRLCCESLRRLLWSARLGREQPSHSLLLLDTDGISLYLMPQLLASRHAAAVLIIRSRCVWSQYGDRCAAVHLHLMW